jgi:pimeloyl-ACP methyl ester carboxylesterase
MQSMQVIALVLVLAVGCAGTSPREPRSSEVPAPGRESVLEALQPPRHRGALSAILRRINPARLFPARRETPKRNGADRSDHGRFELQLRDGTVVGGVLESWWGDESGSPLPLWIASSGILPSRWGSESAQSLGLRPSRTHAPCHVLVLDHPGGGAFFGNNAMLSVGGYDDARMWIEVAQFLKQDMNISRVHLAGVSMSGQSVVHALIEDKRLGLDLFASGIAISIAPDLAQEPGGQFARLETRKGVENPWRLPEAGGDRGRTEADERKAIWAFVQERFIPSYRAVRPEGHQDLTIARRDVPVFLREAMEARIAFLRDAAPPSWNPEFSLDDLDAFMATTRIAAVIAQVTTPLVLLSARDDPAVDAAMFREVAEAAAGNPWVLAYETPHGGHADFDAAYGPDYLNAIFRRLSDPGVLHTWTGPVSDIALR